MIKSCSNPQCAKPLHYLREGRIFVFDAFSVTTGTKDRRTCCLEHYWLCGECSLFFTLEQTCEGIRLAPRSRLRFCTENLAWKLVASINGSD